jgi:predicted PurR-regulated permease PerM
VSVLPVLGSALVWGPATVFLLLQQRVGAAIMVAVAGGLVASNVDNVVRLVVYRRVSGIHPMLTLVGAFAGVRAFGLVGVFVGPLMLSYFMELLALRESFSERQQQPLPPVAAPGSLPPATPAWAAEPVGEP